MKSPKLTTEIIQPLTERDAEPNRDMQNMMVRAITMDSHQIALRDSYIKPLSTICIMVAHASVASSKPKVELDLHADMCVVGDNSLVIHDHNRPVNGYSYNTKDGHRSAKTIDATVGYKDPQSGEKFILMIKQIFCIDGLENNL